MGRLPHGGSYYLLPRKANDNRGIFSEDPRWRCWCRDNERSGPEMCPACGRFPVSRERPQGEVGATLQPKGGSGLTEQGRDREAG